MNSLTRLVPDPVRAGPAAVDIELVGVEKRFETKDGAVQALARVDLSIGRGEFLVLVGASGCGKTTLLRIIGGLLRPSSGEVRVLGRDLWADAAGVHPAMREVGVVFQDANLFPWLSVERNIALPLKLRGISKSERLDKARELCRLVGVAGFEKSLPRELSGGMRQRVAIARALSYDPRILLMDEPFGALDAITRDQMNVETQRIWDERGCTIVLVTHSITEAAYLGSRVVLLSARPGRIDCITPLDFPRPRPLDIQSTPEFQAVVSELRHRLEGAR
jgi:NitT/TauT family transport system ATP-binding protein